MSRYSLLDFGAVPRHADSACCVIHLYGCPAPLPKVGRGPRRDRRCAQPPGPFRTASIACSGVSFYPTKNLGGIGDGGAVVTDDAAVDAAVRTLRSHGMTEQYVHESISQNFRMSEIEAAQRIGLSSLHDRGRDVESPP
jgi:hypothetical protein